MIVNEATCEVTVEIAGKAFRLHATMPRVGQLQAELGVNSFTGIHEALQRNDVPAVLIALRCLCVSDNEGELETLPFGPTIGDGVAAIYKALSAGLPDEKAAPRGNGSAATVKTPRPGRDTGDSLSAS